MSNAVSSSPALTASLLAAIDATNSAVLIGSWFTILLCGVALAQAYSYFKEYPSDKVWIKAAVWFVTFLNILHAVFACIAAYHYLISPQGADLFPNYWALSASVATHLIIAVTVLLYFTKSCFHLLEGRKVQIPTIIVLCLPIALHLGFGTATLVTMSMVESLLELDSFRGVTLVPMFASQVVADACVSLALCLALPHDRSGFKQTHNLMLTIIIYIVSRGIVTSVAAMVELLAITIAPHALWFVCAELTIAGLYTNSFLSALNSRNALRKCVKGNATVVSKISIPIAFTNSRAGDDDHGSIHSDRPDPTSQGVKAEFVDYKENAHDEV